MRDRSTGTLFCASTRTWRASLGESCSIGVPPLAFRASRNFLMSAATEAFTIDAGMFYPFAEGWGAAAAAVLPEHATRPPLTPLLIPLGARAESVFPDSQSPTKAKQGACAAQHSQRLAALDRAAILGSLRRLGTAGALQRRAPSGVQATAPAPMSEQRPRCGRALTTRTGADRALMW